MLNLQDPIQLKTYLYCLNRAKIGDIIEFYLEEEKTNYVNLTFTYDRNVLSSWKLDNSNIVNSKIIDHNKVYRIVNKPTPLSLECEVVFSYPRDCVDPITHKPIILNAPVVASTHSNISNFRGLNRYWAMNEEETAKYRNHFGIIVTEGLLANKIRRKPVYMNIY